MTFASEPLMALLGVQDCTVRLQSAAVQYGSLLLILTKPNVETTLCKLSLIISICSNYCTNAVTKCSNS